MLRIALQILGIVVLMFALTIITLKLANQNADGPSILFPGGALVSGDLHSGSDPDWSFTDTVPFVELQLEDPVSSRRIFVMEYDGKVYVPSGYMRSTLGRIWKEWAFQADEGDGLAVVRINGIRYERQLIRLTTAPTDNDVLGGVAAKLAQKYGGGATPEAIATVRQQVADGDTWIFELAPRGATR